jgi:hypothetical protein
MPPIGLITSVICHDSGAANLIFAWLKAWNDDGLLFSHEFRFFLSGPAENAWQQNPVPLSNIQIYKSLEAALKSSQCVLTGTGWASNLEHQARQKAHALGISCIAVIDHWVNYEMRFERAGQMLLPDTLWVSDPYAADMANQIFKGIPVIELPNVYLQNMVKAIPPVQPECCNVLYVLEPIRNDWGRGLAGEFQALDFFVQHVVQMVGAQPVHISLRPHPSDAPGKYDAWIQAHAHLNVGLDTHPTLNQAIEQAKWVVGAETFAMVVADAAGRQTYSSLPPWAHRCSLPQSSIQHLRDCLS